MRENLTDNEMRQIRQEKLTKLRSENKDPHNITSYEVSDYSVSILDRFDDYEGKNVSVAGRVLGKRGHGKISFIDLQDAEGRIQVLAKFNIIGEEDFPAVRGLDIGDIIGVKGTVMRTEAGEITVQATSIVLLTKSLQLLPEKYHGLKDQDLRYRQRYIDLIVNPEVKQVFKKRSTIISGIREFLDNRGYLEVETPILNTISGGATARPFITHHNTLDLNMYLRIANELYLKRLIVGGFDKVYEMGRMFRNEGMDSRHNPEYTAIELYEAYTDYEGMMNITEQLVSSVCQKVNGSMVINYQGKEIDFTPPWNRITMTEAVLKYGNVDFSKVTTDEEAHRLAEEHNIKVESYDGRGKILAEFFDTYAEDKMIQPTFVYEYPVEISPLSKRMKDKTDMTERFEAFVNGWEIANAFSELNDAQDQRQRFEHQVKLREKGDDEAGMMDEDFVNALEIGLPPTGGLGIGVDRLVMLLTNQTSIRDVLLFPTMKPLGGQSSENGASESGSTEKMVENRPVKTEIDIFDEIDFSKVQIEPLFEDMIDFEEFQRADYRAVKVLNCEEVPKSKKLLKFTLDDGSDKERVILSGIKQNYSAEELIGKTLLAICNLPPRKMMGIDSEGMIISAIHEEEGEERLNLIMLSPRIPAGAKIY